MPVDGQLEEAKAELQVQAAVITQQAATIAEQATKLAEQATKIAKLEEQLDKLTRLLGQNSTNSHKPPSSDRPGSRAGGSSDATPGKRGGQKGHRGAYRKLLPASEVDTFVDLFPEYCTKCGARLPRVEDIDASRYQWVDLQPARHVSEARRHTVQCSCGHRTRARYDAKIIPSSPFGARLCAVVVLLTGTYHLSRERCRTLLVDLFDVHISLGAISAIEARMSSILVPAMQEAEELVQAAAVKHTDATTWLRAGVTMSLWVLASSLATVYKIYSDGKSATIQKLFGESFNGILVSDRATVFGFWAMNLRQICWAHLIRKFVEISQRDGPAESIGKELLECADLVFHYWHAFRRGELTREELWTWIRPIRLHFERVLERACVAEIPEVSGSIADMLAHREALWTFVTQEGVEPTNNHAERELRPMVLWRKRSFGCQSERGERFVERIMSVAKTARKLGLDILDFLVKSARAAEQGLPVPRLLAPI